MLRGCIESNPGQHLRTKNVSIVHNNVCSLIPKIHIINNDLSGNDIIAIIETHRLRSLTVKWLPPPLRRTELDLEVG